MSSLVVADSTELSTTDEEQLVTMMVDGQLFGIPILKVQDIVEPDQITPVPLAPAAIAGVLNLRGRIVTVIDLRELLGARVSDDEKQMSVTVEHKGDLYTLLVDSIGDVRSLRKRDFDKPPATLEENMRRLSSGIFGLEDTLLVVLDVDRILDEETIMKSPRRTRRRRVKKATALDMGTGTATKPANDEPSQDAPKLEADNSKTPAASRDAALSLDEAPANDIAAKPETRPVEETPVSSAPASASAGGGLTDLLGGAAKASGLIDSVYDLSMADATLNHFAEGEDLHAVKEGFRAYSLAALGASAAASVDDLKVILDLLVREQGLDDDHFIALAKHANEVMSKARVDAAACHAVLEIIDALRNAVVKH
ncbi:MAG: chemotaxis protein CheW [Alphaproteobacteria bacterium]|nr:chemotaxis protein CheW [Alphaproteobacteria bacterium]